MLHSIAKSSMHARLPMIFAFYQVLSLCSRAVSRRKDLC